MKISFLALLFSAAAARSFAGDIAPLLDKVPCVVADRQYMQVPDRVHLSGMLGVRIENNAINRLRAMDIDRLLEGYRKRPGRQSYDGEHVGKWLHAATLAWVYTGNAELRAKLDHTVRELIKCQQADGYLGTYLPAQRWTEWDVWAHKYNLIGLLTYMRYTGNVQPLSACRKMGDLLCQIFGDQPGKRDILEAGEHVGMAPTSVLEPMVWLYRLTGDPKYGDFCKYILRSWERPNGPHIVSRLLAGKGVDKVGNGKAYEMLSCLNGMLEWYRTTGDPQLLQAARNAWEDIVANRLYITGTASAGELFHGNYEMPNTGEVGETCVTVTWLQFNGHLLRLTGEARFADELERAVYNQLCGAQQPDGRAWGYYVEMEGKKPYTSSLDGQCCLSSGPRGFALVPTYAITTDADGPVVNFFNPGVANLRLRDGTAVKIGIETGYPYSGKITLTVDPAAPHEFTLKLRAPKWCLARTMQTPDATTGIHDGYTVVQRTWNKGDKVALYLYLFARLRFGDHLNADRAAVLRGPLVLAADRALTDGNRVNTLKLASADVAKLEITPEPAPDALKTWPGAEVFRVNALLRGAVKPVQIRLVPFADAGAVGRTFYKVWLPLPTAKDAVEADNLLDEGMERRSRTGNVEGSIIDGRFVTSFNGKPAREDWYSVALDSPATIGRVVFAHGKTFHDGGWFDASAGKPKVQIQAAKGGAWKTIGELADYPAATAADSAKLAEGARFTCKLAEPVNAVAVRVVGKPAHGDAPQQAFSSCGGLWAMPQ